MKKFIVLFICFLTVVSVSAQPVTPTVDPSFFDVIYNLVTGKIAVGTLTVILTIAWVLEQIIPYVKWVPGNSTLAVVWNVFKKIVAFLASKKK